MRLKHIGIFAGVLLAGQLPAQTMVRAQTATPGVVMQPLPRPDADLRPSNLHVLSPADHDVFARAFAAADHGDWATARALGAQGQDSIARLLLAWRALLDPAGGASFAEIDAFLKKQPGWPLRRNLLIRAEQSLPPEMTDADVIAWFAGRDPLTSPGRIRLGDAMVAMASPNQVGAGRALIRRGWILGSFDAATEQQIEQRDGAGFTPQTEAKRLDTLIWQEQISAAKRQLARVDALTRRVGEARIALRAGKGEAAAIAAVPADGASDPSLLFDRAVQERHAGHDAVAHALLLRVDAGAMVGEHTARWWGETNVEARDALTQGDPRTARALVVHAGLTSGDEYADAEFLGGFIALRFLKEPKIALGDFQKLGAAVSRPISRARAAYWQGRAYEAMDDKANAWRQYNLAAASPETFYGQLALTRIDPAAILHVPDFTPEAAPESALDGDALMPEMRVLADLGQAQTLRYFTERDVEGDASPARLKRLMLDLTDWGYPEIAVRLAKQASYTGAGMLAFTHPVIALPPYAGPGTAPGAALVLGIIRQETEFNPYAVSGAGARGLMQVMSATARKSAQLGNMAFRPGDLLRDTNYNIQLGMIELAGRLADWNGSLVLAAAAYNAGPTNARRWIAANGDPAANPGQVDPVDWIERIPFGETRNYVQRVLENTEVYRNRLAGHDMAARIMSDLYAPAAPPAAGLGYTPPGQAATSN